MDALIAVRDAWESAKPSTISNCFRHCGFEAAGTSCAKNPDNENDELIAEIATDLSMSKEDVQDFVKIDQNVLSSSSMTDEEIIEEILGTSQKSSTEEEEEDQSTPALQVPMYAQVMDSLAVLRRGLVSFPSTKAAWKELSAIEQCFINSRQAALQQTSITDYFTKP